MKSNPRASSRKAGTATHAVFPTTCWTALVSLQSDEDNSIIRNQALSALCQIYWFPLYAFARHRGMTSHDAEDAVQSFFLSISDTEYFEKADQNKGKMRTFLLTGFTRHIKDMRVHAAALKRGGGKHLISLDADQAEEWLQIDPNTVQQLPDMQFERHWAHSTIRAVIDALRQDSASSPKSAERFQKLSRFLNPQTCADYTQQQAAEDLGLTESACNKAIQRLRQNFRHAVREQVASTLDNPDHDQIMEEMQQLQRALAAE